MSNINDSTLKINGRPSIDLTGKKFGRLLVIGLFEKTSHGNRWLCLCDCGNQKVVGVGHLRSGDTKSCGCYNSEESRKRRLTHGYAPMSRNGGPIREYRIWRGMKRRCYDHKQPGYKFYGGRGIKVCDKWLDDFSAFYSDMGPSPSKKHSLDRFPNVDGDYGPDNCRWATPKQQGENKRNARIIECDGVSMRLEEWANKLNVPYKTLWSFLKKNSIKDAIIFYVKKSYVNNEGKG